MSTESGNAGNDMEKSNGPKLENALGLNTKLIMLSLTLDQMSKLHELMVRHNYLTVNQMIANLIEMAV